MREEKCQNGCKFKDFLNPLFYPLSQKGAYKIHRKVSTSSSVHGLEGTRRGINSATALFSKSEDRLYAKTPNYQYILHLMANGMF